MRLNWWGVGVLNELSLQKVIFPWIDTYMYVLINYPGISKNIFMSSTFKYQRQLPTGKQPYNSYANIVIVITNFPEY